MKSYVLSLDADFDLDDIWEYIAADSFDAADCWIAKLFDAFETRPQVADELCRRRRAIDESPRECANDWNAQRDHRHGEELWRVYGYPADDALLAQITGDVAWVSTDEAAHLEPAGVVAPAVNAWRDDTMLRGMGEARNGR